MTKEYCVLEPLVGGAANYLTLKIFKPQIYWLRCCFGSLCRRIRGDGRGCERRGGHRDTSLARGHAVAVNADEEAGTALARALKTVETFL